MCGGISLDRNTIVGDAERLEVDVKNLNEPASGYRAELALTYSRHTLRGASRGVSVPIHGILSGRQRLGTSGARAGEPTLWIIVSFTYFNLFRIAY